VRQEASDKGKSCKRGEDESDKVESQWMTFPIKDRIVVNCLLLETRGFIYKRDVKKRINKNIENFLEEGKAEMAGK